MFNVRTLLANAGSKEQHKKELLIARDAEGRPAAEKKMVPIEGIFQAAFFRTGTSLEEQKKIVGEYEKTIFTLSTPVDNLINKLQAQNSNNYEVSIRLPEELMLITASIVFHKIHGPRYERDSDMVSFILRREFNCQVSTTIMADIITRLGGEVKIKALKGHVVLASRSYVLETTKNPEEAPLLPESEFDERHQVRMDGGVELLEAMAWTSRGGFLANQLRLDESLEAINRALEINPKEMWAMLNKGIVLYMKGRYIDALEALDEALNINPNIAAAQFRRNIILQMMGRNSKLSE